MRNLTASALSKIAQHYGNEPVTIIEVQWALDGAIYTYADIKIDNIPGQILEVSNLDNVINISDSSSSQEISIILDDTDGKIKSIMNSNDIHKRDVWVYQWFQGLSLDDKFLLFRGKINTPIKWSEGAQTISFSVISQLEDKEIGFSPEEGQFPFIPNDLIGNPWPLIFGTAVDVPVVQITQAITGTLLTGVGVVSGTASFPPFVSSKKPDVTMLNLQADHCSLVASASSDDKQRLDFRERENDISQQIAETFGAWSTADQKARAEYMCKHHLAQTKGEGPDQVRILGGEDFPRGKIIINCGSNEYTGQFEGDSDEFIIHSRINIPNTTSIRQENTNDDCVDSSPTLKPNTDYYWQTKVPPGDGDGVGLYATAVNDTITTRGFIIWAAETDKDPPDTINVHQSWNDAGSTITYSMPVTYVISIIPGTVLRVKAFKDFNGLSKLIDVPEEYYTIKTVTYGSIQAVQLTMNKVLSAIPEQYWSDEVYVTFESSIGPNIIDILKYLINTYTDLSYDNTTFTEVRAKLEPFPANFAYLDRKNIVTVLEEIAFQARCSLMLNNGVFYIKYLAEEPVPIDTVTEGDIKTQSIEVSLTPTEDIVTKYIAEWQISGAQDTPNKIILRHNVKKYGIQEETYNYYIYNQPDIILKIATFWLIRKSNSWKQIKFDVFLNKLNIETFDAVTLNFHQNYIATSDVISIIKAANLDSENQTISLECWLPIKSGEMAPYGFAWPAQVDPSYVFPTDTEIDLGLAGGNGIGAHAEGNLPIGDTSTIESQAIFIGGPNIVFGPNADYGDHYPSDIGFSASSLNIPTVTGELLIQSIPSINVNLAAREEIPDPEITELPIGPSAIVLEETRVVSINSLDKYDYLADVFRRNDDKKKLAIKTTALFDDQDNCDVFDFEYDTEGEKWGAGTAFLQDE